MVTLFAAWRSIVTGREAFGEGAGGIKSRGSFRDDRGGLLNARYDEHVKSNVAIMAAASCSAVRKSRCLRERKFRWIAVESISCVLCFELQVK